jgi:hypothetical protein
MCRKSKKHSKDLECSEFWWTGRSLGSGPGEHRAAMTAFTFNWYLAKRSLIAGGE